MAYTSSKITFRVFNTLGQDVTHDKTWVLDHEGTLYFTIDSIYYPFRKADGYYYEIVDIEHEAHD